MDVFTNLNPQNLGERRIGPIEVSISVEQRVIWRSHILVV